MYTTPVVFCFSMTDMNISEQFSVKEEFMQHPDFQKTVDFYRKNGWHVEIGNKTELVQAVPELQCGDGRYANLPKNARKAGIAIFGGLSGVAALKTGGTEVGIQKATDLVRSKGLTPGIHGDEHGPLSCGLFHLWKAGALKSIKGIKDFLLPDEQALFRQLNSLGVVRTDLPGHHTEKMLTISFVGGKTPALSPDTFRLNGELPQKLGIDLNLWLETSEHAVKLLTKNSPGGPVNTVRIIG